LRRAFPSLRVRRKPADAEGAHIGSLRVSMRATPGHAADGLTWIIEEWPGGAPPVAPGLGPCGNARTRETIGGLHGKNRRGRQDFAGVRVEHVLPSLYIAASGADPHPPRYANSAVAGGQPKRP
jgi:hypothetical protein